MGRGRENCLSCEKVIGKAIHEIDVFGNIHNVRPISFMIFDPSSEDFMNHILNLLEIDTNFGHHLGIFYHALRAPKLANLDGWCPNLVSTHVLA